MLPQMHASAASLPATPTDTQIILLPKARSAPVSRNNSAEALEALPVVPKLKLPDQATPLPIARTYQPRSQSARHRPGLVVHSARTMRHMSQPAVLTQRDGNDLLAGTRALPVQTVADGLLKKHHDVLVALKSNPAAMDAVRARLTPREPLTLALKSRLEQKDKRIADLEAQLHEATARRIEPPRELEGSSIVQAVDDVKAKQQEGSDSALSTPARTPIGQRPFAMSPTNQTGTSFLVAAFAEAAEAERARSEAEDEKIERAALLTFERAAEERARHERMEGEERRQRQRKPAAAPPQVSLTSIGRPDETARGMVQAEVTEREAERFERPRRPHAQYTAPKQLPTPMPTPRAMDMDDGSTADGRDARGGGTMAISEALRLAWEPTTVRSTKATGSRFLGAALPLPFADRMAFASEVRPVRPLPTPRSPFLGRGA